MKKTILILGGGQLGLMLCHAARVHFPDCETVVLDKPGSACEKIAHRFIQGDFTNEDHVLKAAHLCDPDAITIEIEKVNANALKLLYRPGLHSTRIVPTGSILECIQDKAVQKSFLQQRDLPVVEYTMTTSDIDRPHFPFPYYWKARTGGYDGRGVIKITSEEDFANIPSHEECPGIFEPDMKPIAEVSVTISFGDGMSVATYDPVEMGFDRNNQLDYLKFPVSAQVEKSMPEIELIASHFRAMFASQLVGNYSLELFVTQDGNVYINEIAPRLHNSAHHTDVLYDVGQAEMLLARLLGESRTPKRLYDYCRMVNLVGRPDLEGPVYFHGVRELQRKFQNDDVVIDFYDYNKGRTKPGRKMGHITIAGNDERLVKHVFNYARDTVLVTTKIEV